MSLITNITQIKEASTILISNTLANWKPYLAEAEDTFIKPVIGKNLLKALDDEANGSASGVSKYDELLTRMRISTALYGLYLGIDEMAVSISASGIQEISNETRKPAPLYKVKNLKESLIARANRQLDLALEYIEEHLSDFPEYDALDDDLFIHNAKEFQEHVDIRGSRRVFIAMKGVMKNIEKRYIRPTLSDAFYSEMKTALQSSSSSGMSADDQAVIDLIRPAIAHLTIARALKEISIDMLDWGVFDTAGNTFDNIQGKQEANATRIGMMIDANQLDGEADLKELQIFLDKNASATKYSTYFNSDVYADPAADRPSLFVNGKDKSIFVA